MSFKIYNTTPRVTRIDDKLFKKIESYKNEDEKNGRPASFRMASRRLAEEHDDMAYEIEKVKKTFPLYKFRKVERR